MAISAGAIGLAIFAEADGDLHVRRLTGQQASGILAITDHTQISRRGQESRRRLTETGSEDAQW